MKKNDIIRYVFSSPRQEYLVAIMLLLGLADHYFFSGSLHLLVPTALIGAIIPLGKAWEGVRQKTITIELFNFLALVASFVTGEIESASFIGLMLTFAAYLDWHTESRASHERGARR